MPGTILLGVDVESADESSAMYSQYGAEMLAATGIRATWYVTGRTLERYPHLFRRAEGTALVELQAHTYDHILLKTVLTRIPPGLTIHGKTDWWMTRGGSNEEIDRDLARCQGVFRDALGRTAAGLTGPWAYYRGLGDRPDLLEIVGRHGFRLLRTFGRNETDGQPVPMEWQPFFYAPQGFPDILEILIHDYQDDYLFREFSGLPDASTYPAHLREVADRVAREDLVWSLCTHDHGCRTHEAFKAKTAWLEDIVRYARSLGIRFVTASEYYAERLGARPTIVGGAP
jgi:peptidoglycan/xylan/chitin deacetylase (PgdA/CDA1 family)